MFKGTIYHKIRYNYAIASISISTSFFIRVPSTQERAGSFEKSFRFFKNNFIFTTLLEGTFLIIVIPRGRTNLHLLLFLAHYNKCKNSKIWGEEFVYE